MSLLKELFCAEVLGNFIKTYTDVIKIISVLLLKSIVPKHEAISEAEITVSRCLRNGEGI